MSTFLQATKIPDLSRWPRLLYGIIAYTFDLRRIADHASEDENFYFRINKMKPLFPQVLISNKPGFSQNAVYKSMNAEQGIHVEYSTDAETKKGADCPKLSLLK